MSRRVHPHSTLAENLKLIGQIVPWRLFLLIPLLLFFAIPAFLFGTGAGHHFLPRLTGFFYNLSNTTPTILPTPLPPLTQLLPQPGAVIYSVQAADSCDEILSSQMNMVDAGEIFSDTIPQTIAALSSSLGQNCSDLQPGERMTLMPQYPLVALGGVVLNVYSLSPAQPLPTPLIPIQQHQQPGVDCSNGCLLNVRIAAGVEVKLSVQTAIPVPVGAWVWAQATYPRKPIAGFANYPYADPATSLNGKTLRVCDFQVNDTHDDNSLSCDQLTPNTIDDDGGAWLFGVTGKGGLNHWDYHLQHLASGTQVLLWLSVDSNDNLIYSKGNPAYRYDQTLHYYVPI